MVHAVCSQGELQVWVFQRAFCWCRCCAWWSVESACWSPLSFLKPRPAWGKSPFHREAVCKFAVCKEYSESVSSPPKRESCLEKCKSLNCGRACMCGLLVELNINSYQYIPVGGTNVQGYFPALHGLLQRKHLPTKFFHLN